MTGIGEYLQHDPRMARLTNHAATLLRLQKQLACLLPEPLRRSVRVANLKGGRLLLHADHGAAAARLRQQAPSLTDALRLQGGEITGIDVRVQPLGPEPPHQTPIRASLSQHGRHSLAVLADQLPNTSPLKQALQRLLIQKR